MILRIQSKNDLCLGYFYVISETLRKDLKKKKAKILYAVIRLTCNIGQLQKWALRENCPNSEFLLVDIQSKYRKIETRKISVFGQFLLTGKF